MSEDLQRLAETWRPNVRIEERELSPVPFRAFADLLDKHVPLVQGDPLPVLWHWLAMGGSCPQAELGEDGHPSQGHFLPPFENRRRMIAGGRIEQREPFIVGGRYRRESELLTIQAKEGRSGPMLFTSLRHTFRDESSAVVALEEEDVVYRQQIPGASRGNLAADHSVTTTAWHDTLGDRNTRTFAPDNPILFRFSALTYNSHRIHYDADYAREVEGYPALVVHGPLLALYLLELPRRAGLPVPRFSYRLTAPAFLGHELTATWDDDALRIGMSDAATASAQGQIEVAP